MIKKAAAVTTVTPVKGAKIRLMIPSIYIIPAGLIDFPMDN